jgi:hypothetical protein
MKKINIALITLLIVSLISCGTNEPANYSNIKGSWHCTETSDQGSYSFIVDVYRLKADTTIYLFSNFHNVTFDDAGDIRVKQTGSKLTIESEQSIPSTLVVVKKGSGLVATNFMKMEMDYDVLDGQRYNTIHAIFSR